MAKEWFGVEDLRRASVPDFDEDYFTCLCADFDSLAPGRARYKFDYSVWPYETYPEFHISVFAPLQQARLARFYCDVPVPKEWEMHPDDRARDAAARVAARITKLGICGEVRFQESFYVGFGGNYELPLLEALLELRNRPAPAPVAVVW